MSVKKADASIKCTICKLVAQEVEKYAEENSTEVRIFILCLATLFIYAYRQR